MPQERDIAKRKDVLGPDPGGNVGEWLLLLLGASNLSPSLARICKKGGGKILQKERKAGARKVKTIFSEY